MKKKIVVIVGTLGIIALVMIAVICWNNPYDAKIYSEKDTVHGWVKVEFLGGNTVYGAHYFNPECLEDSDETTELYCKDMESPKTRTFLIKDEETFKEIFYEDTLDVDFEKEMIVLYIFSDKSSAWTYVLKNVSVDDDTVEISIRKKLFSGGGAMRSFQRCVVIKMQKLDVDNVKVIK